MASTNTAYVEEANDETGSAIPDGPKTYARSVAPGSPIKEQANSGKSRKDTMRGSSSLPQHGLTDSDDDLPPTASEKRKKARRPKERDLVDKEPRREERRRVIERDREKAERRERETAAPKRSAVRPSTRHHNTAPVVTTQHSDEYRRPRFQDEPSQYGIPMPAQGPRPKPASGRPHSYYGQGSRPPPSNERWYAAHNPPVSPFAPIPVQPIPMQSPFSPVPGPSYPPQGWVPPMGSMPYPMQQQAPPQPPPPQPSDYFAPPGSVPQQSQAHLAQRFQQRPSSAMGYHRSMSGSFDHDPHEKENIVRRRSVKIRDDDARKLMPPPPPPRSRTTAPRQPFQPPPPQRQIASTGYDSDDFDGDESLYQEFMTPEYGDGVISRPHSHRRGSSTYSRDGYRMEPALTSGRRNSYMGTSAGSYSERKYEANVTGALAYQDGVNGTSVPLTYAALQAAKKSKSSRSSGSSGSRDESDFRQSATTRTTRSALDGEDVTIKVTGSAVLKIGGAEIECKDGGEINIVQPGRHGGSDKASTVYSDDRQSRRERLPIRARASSPADSWGRSQAHGYELTARPPFF